LEINQQLLDEITQFPKEDPYRINLTICARYRMLTIKASSSDKQLVRTLLPYQEGTVSDLYNMGVDELQTLRERAALQ